jgi:diguanylate cyclase (GGDEF)-like protein
MLNLLSLIALTTIAAIISRRFGKEYARHWTFSLGFLAVSIALSHLTPVLREAGPLATRSAAALTTAAWVLHLLFLLFGVMVLAQRKPIRLSHFRSAVAVTAAAGAIAGAILIGTESHLLLWSVVATAAVALLSGLALLTRRGPVLSGASLLGVALAFEGAVQSAMFVAKLIGSSPLILLRADSSAWQTALAGFFLIALLDEERDEAASAASTVEHLAYHDSLTGLPNRSLFFDSLIAAVSDTADRSGGPAVLFIDLDRFKLINDSFGHSTGDLLLRALSRRIRESIRSTDLLARFGGDELVLMISDVQRPEIAVAAAERILALLSKPLRIAGRDLTVTCSIGISIYPRDGEDAESLVKNADTAMYRAKELGRNNSQRYTADLSVRARASFDFESHLRHAIQRGELRLYYQPIIDLENTRLYGFEALLRWQHPERGLLQPSEFLPAAEVAGLMLPLGRWVLDHACQQAASWPVRTDSLSVAVNLSGDQMIHTQTLTDVRHALAGSGLDPHRLSIEITETTAMDHNESTLDLLNELRRIGIRIAIDDFGSGYSSLDYLRRFPLDQLKLDRSFVRDLHLPGGQALSIAAIEMAHALGLEIVAEGVEDEFQLAFLRNRGCHLAQGYLFARPMPVEEVGSFIARFDPLILSQIESRGSMAILQSLIRSEEGIWRTSDQLDRTGSRSIRPSNN